MRVLPSLALVLLLVLWLPATGAALVPADGQGSLQERSTACVGTMTEQPGESTRVSIQGAHVTDDGYVKRPALLVSYAPNGSFEWTRNASANGRWWAYDVDPLPNGNLLFGTTEAGISVVGELDPETNEYAWTERFEGAPDDPENPRVTDAHDADLIDGDEIVVADKGEGHERLLVYDREEGRTTWEWRFEDHPEQFPESGGGPADDWTHVNDVDPVNASESDRAEGTGQWFMASVRNFDQVVFVNRSSTGVELTLGADDDHDVLHRQHNPDHLWGPDGEHTVLVADSLNDRAVEYEYDREAGEWERVWAMTGLNEPRDADRLPSGNTLITDRKGHRVVEVTPDGEVVWEVYTPYEPYDAERGAPGSDGPTMREHGVEGSFEVSGDADFSEEEIADCAGATFEFAPADSGILPGDHGGRFGGLPVVPIAVGGALVVLAGVAAAAFRYRR